MTAGGRAYCWGSDAAGQLGDGGASRSSTRPVAVAGDYRFILLAAGDNHVCGLDARGTVACWGENAAGQLGINTSGGIQQSPVPVDASIMPRGDTFVSIVSGKQHTCGVSARGRTYCWGSDAAGQLGDGGASKSSPMPMTVEILDP